MCKSFCGALWIQILCGILPVRIWWNGSDIISPPPSKSYLWPVGGCNAIRAAGEWRVCRDEEECVCVCVEERNEREAGDLSFKPQSREQRQWAHWRYWPAGRRCWTPDEEKRAQPPSSDSSSQEAPQWQASSPEPPGKSSCPWDSLPSDTIKRTL